ncbi:hypothetical protein ACFUJY_23070 [Streptomyces sp. NPDC057249]|uniref:hypothetical protein n=1 Tax=Streptomyces sp. NPDC057249 TaxID=3346067 RepID=UPI003638BE15
MVTLRALAPGDAAALTRIYSRHLTFKGLEAAATELQRALSEMGATARGAGAAGATHPMALNETASVFSVASSGCGRLS